MCSPDVDCGCPPPNVLVVFVNTHFHTRKAMLQESLERCGCRNFRRIGGGEAEVPRFSWWIKVGQSQQRKRRRQKERVPNQYR